MNSEIQVKIKDKFVHKLEKGYPLIAKESILNSDDLQKEGSIIKLVDERNRFIAKGYFGKQNKGYGWILTAMKKKQLMEPFLERSSVQHMTSGSLFLKSRYISSPFGFLMEKEMELVV